MRNTTHFAKLVRPSGSGLIQRARLYSRLNAILVGGQVAWVCGPAGAGKSSLVIGWTRSLQRPCAWYQLDERDAEPAAFFHSLVLLQASTPDTEQGELPRLTEGCPPGLAAFSRRFFEELYASLPDPFTLVLDNVHELPCSKSTDAILLAAVQTLPAHGALVLVSRAPPAPGLARCAASTAFHLIDYDALAMHDDEACELARSVGLRDVQAVRALNERVRGWAAGLALTVRACSSRVELPLAAAEQSSALLFDFIATEIFGRLPAPMRGFLLRTSVLPYVRGDLAQELSGQADANRHLRWLHEQRLLTTLRPDPVNTYEYDPLFREFLLQRAEQELGPVEWVWVHRHAAQLLEGIGETEAAAALWTRTQSWAELAALACRHAPKVLAEGRLATLASWIDAIPPASREGSPWLLYWSGMCESLRDPAVGWPHLEAAYALFKSRADRSGMALSLAGILSGYFLQWGDLRSADRWIPELDEFLARFGTELPLQEEVQLLGGCTVLMMRQPGHPRLGELIRRASQLMRDLEEPALRGALVPFVLCHRLWWGDYSGAQALCEDLMRHADAATPVIARLFLQSLAGAFRWQQAEHERAHAVLQAGLRLAEETGIHLADARLHTQEAYASLSEGDLAAAELSLERAAHWLRPSHQLDVVQYRSLQAGMFMYRGDLERAIALAHECVARVDELGFRFGLGAFRVQLGQMLMLAGHHPEAQEQFSAVLSEWRPLQSDIMCFHAGTGLAWSRLQSGDDDGAVASLREALEIGARRAYMNCHPWWLPRVMSDVCARALAEDIQSDYVKRLIARRGLAPPKHVTGLTRWPWPIRVRTLGVFEVTVGGQPLPTAAKAQKKPLELLKALAAHGCAGAAHGVLADQLWPELVGDSARNSLHTAMHRLRKLLGDEEAIVVHEGIATLNETKVWTDVREVERCLTSVCELPQTEFQGAAAAAPTALRLARALPSLYAGDFLGQEELPDWAVQTRARLHARVRRGCAKLGQALEAAGAFEDACALCSRMLEVDPLAEEFHRGLMRCLAAQGRFEEALDAYDRCCALLLSAQGTLPTAATEAVRQGFDPK